MSSGYMRSAPSLGLERFSGRKREFTMWKDKVLAHINQLDQEYARSMLEKDQPAPTVLMEDFLAATPEKPEISVAKEVSKEEAREERWRNQRPVAISVVKKTTGRKRNQDESSGQGSDECFYCFNTGHRKANCPVKVKDRDPIRQDGPLFRTDIRKLPGVGKKKRLMTVKNKKKAVPAAGATNSRNGKSSIDGLLFDKDLEEELQDADELDFEDKVPVSEGGESISSVMDIEDEV
ncbi:unnamed protein product [Phytophthora fragariaefolia]|uniref:Unnamed protein product n=1 Tax=Phytophthora fragariaefolia TaxID=1490495 RepID=A0A9W6Y403_9STRA|nr:unnamed protein product [Phytophthora fragariaefolia]